MTFAELVAQWLQQGLKSSLGPFAPELVISAAVVGALLVRLGGFDRAIPAWFVALGGSLFALLLAVTGLDDVPRTLAVDDQLLFTGLLRLDPWAAFFRVYVLLFTVLIVGLIVLTRLVDHEDNPDLFAMLLGATLGMLLMCSANHVLMLFLGIEMASIPSYAMTGFFKGRRQSGEAALKFAVYGAAAAGIMLYGLSLVCGILGTADLREFSPRLALIFGDASLGERVAETRGLALGLILILAGFGFKLSLVPFHFWCPDAFEGAAAEIAAYLSVASKGAAFAALVRFLAAIFDPTIPAMAAMGHGAGIVLGGVAILTATLGNLAAYPQTNLKRLFAYSTIAHAGYLLMGVAAWLVLSSSSLVRQDGTPAAQRALEGLVYYLVAYLFMNLVVFAATAMIRNQIFSEDLRRWSGLGASAPLLTGCLAAGLFSLIGLPPFGGFVGKLFVFSSLVDASSLHGIFWLVLAAGAINTVFSLFYYVKILRVMVLSPRTAATAGDLNVEWADNSYLLMITIPIVVLGLAVPLVLPICQWAAGAWSL